MGQPIPAKKKLGTLVAGTGLADLYVQPGSAPNSITEGTALWVINTDSASHTFTLRAGPLGALVKPDHSFFEDSVLQANQVLLVDSNSGEAGVLIVGPGEHIQGSADAANKVIFRFFGQETNA